MLITNANHSMGLPMPNASGELIKADEEKDEKKKKVISR